jgi:5'-3' exonuclease
MDRILLIDTLNFIWRASIPFSPKNKSHLYNEKTDLCICGAAWEDNKCENEPSNEFVIIYNFFKNLRPLIEQFYPDKCFFVLEGHPKFRYDLYSDYKGNRLLKQASQPSKQKVYQSADEINRLLTLLPVTMCRAANYECDDVISFLCENMKDEHLTVTSNDSDYIQLLQRRYKSCQIYNPIRKEFMEAPEYPYIAWKALAGDKSDNIPALMTAAKAVSTVSSPEKFRKFFSKEENRASFNINRQLIEFTKVPEEDIIFTEGLVSFDDLKKEFEKMKFKSLLIEKTWNKFVETFDCLKF